MILGSKDLADYGADTGQCPYSNENVDRCLIYAKNARNIGLTGKGTICGNYTKMVPAPGASDSEKRQLPDARPLRGLRKGPR